ncbi:OLC1v1028988C1 [Oldenlandia corymbosa var. corymbosa]|uniref:OLC1v1028988C1 n=1 Tax=Oldenlandia corymbosa var. corymbosa TaxID=529605 RepID=A0AAV1CED6_OLDCO|nr:OLC1v1028988C1 [Oldenlandia corymbosa var. corymbosa]
MGKTNQGSDREILEKKATNTKGIQQANPRQTMSKGVTSLMNPDVADGSKKLSELLCVSAARRIDWSARQSIDLVQVPHPWDQFDPKKLKIGAKLEFIQPTERDGKKVCKMQKQKVQTEVEY